MESSFVKPATRKLSARERVRRSLVSEIAEGFWSPGDLLPPEQQLADRFGVSRNIVREVMGSLQTAGVVSIKQGNGTFVTDLPLNGVTTGLTIRLIRSARGDLKDLRDLLEIRQVIESGLAARVIAEVVDTSKLEQLVEAMVTKASRGEFFQDLDYEFHRQLYMQIDNSVAVELISLFWKTYNSVDSLLPPSTYTLAASAQWHQDILRALQARDLRAYEQAIQAHFWGVASRLR